MRLVIIFQGEEVILLDGASSSGYDERLNFLRNLWWVQSLRN